MKPSQKIALQVGNILFLIAAIAFNGLANAGLREGMSVGDISDKYFTLFAPAGFTFSIWGVIYLALIAFVVYQGRDLFRRGQSWDMPWLGKVSFWFMLSCVFNVLWLFAWVYERIGLAFFLILALLGSLTFIYLRLHVGLRAVGQGEKYLVHLPFSLYLAWVNVATIANASALLVAEGWTPPFFDVGMWTAVVVIVVGMIGVFVTGQRNDIAFGAVFAWALLGIFVKHQQLEDEGLLSVKIATWVGIGMIAITAILNSLRQRSNQLGYV